MAFRLKRNEFFAGLICEPGGDKERVTIQRGTRPSVVKQTVIEAGRANWDWIIKLCRETSNEDQPVEVVRAWSSLEEEDLPPVDRPANL